MYKNANIYRSLIYRYIYNVFLLHLNQSSRNTVNTRTRDTIKLLLFGSLMVLGCIRSIVLKGSSLLRGSTQML